MKLHQSLIRKVVDDPLDILPVASHVTCEPCDRLWLFGGGDGAQYLPARARETNAGDQLIAGHDQSVVQSEKFENEVSQGLAGYGVFALIHVFTCCHIDI